MEYSDSSRKVHLPETSIPCSFVKYSGKFSNFGGGRVYSFEFTQDRNNSPSNMDEERVAALQQFKEAVKPLLTDPCLYDWFDDAWYGIYSPCFSKVRYTYFPLAQPYFLYFTFTLLFSTLFPITCIPFLSLSSCERYLEARAWDSTQSLKLIKHSIAWRLEKRPDITECPLCPQDPFSHSIVRTLLNYLVICYIMLSSD